MPYNGQCLNVGRAKDSQGSTRLSGSPNDPPTLPMIDWLQTVGFLERHHPSSEQRQDTKDAECTKKIKPRFRGRDLGFALVEL
jgi:hypothetical protein